MGTVTGVVPQVGNGRRTARTRAAEPGPWGPIRRIVLLLWWLAAETTRICLRYRVTGLAAEVGFFALLSMPPLVLGMVGSVGFIGDLMGTETVSDLRSRVRELALTFLTPDSVSTVILPTFDQVLGAGRADIVSIGFVLSLWSGSRVLNVYLDTVSIMYGLGGLRGIVRARVLSFSLYCLSLAVGIVVIPLVLIGPTWLASVLRGAGLETLGDIGGSDWVYWPVVSGAAVAGITGLYHLATPVRSRLYRDLPGAVLALVIWVLTSFVLRWALNESVGGPSIYGPLATPIVLLIWLYFLAIALLIGAALNAAIDERWPTPARVAARNQVRERQAARTGGSARNGVGEVEGPPPPEAETLTPLDPRPSFAPALQTARPGAPVPAAEALGSMPPGEQIRGPLPASGNQDPGEPVTRPVPVIGASGAGGVRSAAGTAEQDELGGPGAVPDPPSADPAGAGEEPVVPGGPGAGTPGVPLRRRRR